MKGIQGSPSGSASHFFIESSNMINTLKEFLELLEKTNTYRLFRYTEEAYKEARCYRQVILNKKDGGKRILQVPNYKIKKLQYDLLPYFKHAEISDCAAAYVKGKSLLDHAKQHTDSRMLVKLDIENFFGSITFSKVFYVIDEALKHSPLVGSVGKENDPQDSAIKTYNSSLSWFIAKVCTLNGILPQGAPTSPMLSNMIFFPLDNMIYSYCKKRNICYTRYSDDMIFSGDFKPTGLIQFIRKLLAQNGYILNEDKIVVAGNGRQQKITGVVVNQRPQVDRKYRRAIRQEIYYIGKYGVEEHLHRKGILPDEDGNAAQVVKELQRLIGKIAYVLQIDPKNREFMQYKEVCNDLLHRVPMLWKQ